MQDELTFDLMREQDLESVCKIEKNCFTTPWSKQNFLDSINNKFCCFIVARTAADDIAGYCGFYQSDIEADIVNAAVDKRYRRSRVAWKMLTELMRLGYERGVNAFTLEVRCGNEPAVNLYEKLGFKSVGVRKNFYRNPTEDANIMWLTGLPHKKQNKLT